MILTEKGSTRSNMHLLTACALILLATRIIVYIIEVASPQEQSMSVSWHRAPEHSKKELKDFYVLTRYYKAKLLEEKEKKDSKENVKREESSEKSSESILKEIKGIRKRGGPQKYKSIDLLKLLPGNKSAKPVLLLFTSDKNHFCHYLDRVVLTNKEIRKKITENFFPVRIAYDKEVSETEFALYKIYYRSPVIPAMIVLTEKGVQLKKLMGLPDSIGLNTFLDRSIEEYKKKKKEELLDKKLKSKDDDHKSKELQ